VEVVIALATLGLAIATAWMAWEVHQERIQASHERVRGALRAAMMEQLENARRWYRANPSRRGDDPTALRILEPEMQDTRRLFRDVDLPSDLAGYLLWLIGDTGRVWDEHTTLLNEVASSAGSIDKSEMRRLWGLGLERLQVSAGLVAGELRRRGYTADAAVVASLIWMMPEVWPGGMQARGFTQVSEATYLAAPQFPRDPSFADCTPDARDAHAGQLSAERQARMRDASAALPRSGL
jgi:hypothetical protein